MSHRRPVPSKRFALLGLLAIVACKAPPPSENEQLQQELGAAGFEAQLEQRGVAVLVADMLFESDSDELSKAGLAAAARIAEIAQRIAPGRSMIAEGHSDAQGEAAYNFELSLRRANRVVDALAAAGIPRELLSAQGFGETRPVASETTDDGADDPAGRRRNRRVVLVIANR